MFQIGDTVFVGKSSASSMIYYGEHRNEMDCPCNWKNAQGIVIRIHGNYTWCRDVTNPKKVSAFHFNDLRLVQRAEFDD